MTQMEFLSGLQEALAADLDARSVQEQMAYYRSYISGELAKGRTEEEIMNELGDPWVIARSIIDMQESSAETFESVNEYDGYRKQEGYGNNSAYGKTGGHVYAFGFDTWWKKLLLVLGIIGVLMVVGAVIGGIFSLLAPLILPILVVVLVIRLIGGRGRR